MRRILCVMAVAVGVVAASGAAQTPAAKMAATVRRQSPAAKVPTKAWGYEEGVRLDGMTAEWRATADGEDYAYVKAWVDEYVADDGSVRNYKPEGHTLDDIEMGRAVMVVYRVTQEEKYAKAAKFLHEQLDVQPRTASGGYWHKKTYPNQMWLDGAYMAEPFRAMYAATFKVDDWDDIAKQLLLMDEHMRVAQTGLLRHGWDESKAMPWADKTTGLSPEVWDRALGWYGMALVDVLDFFPKDHPKRKALEDDLRRTMAAVVKVQDPASGVWWEVMDKGTAKGNYLEASGSCMFAYALAKGVRMGYLPQTDAAAAAKAWAGIQKQFVTDGPDGGLVLHGTVKVGGLGGTPYRAGDYAYYLKEAIVDQDAKGVGAFLLAGSEMEQAGTQALGQDKVAVMDGWFNSQVRKDAFGGEHVYHYKWGTDSNEGDSFFGYALGRYGVRLSEMDSAPTAAGLKGAGIYVIVSPDNEAKNPTPHFMDKASGDAVEAWVKAGGVLLLFMNDKDNTEFAHFNTLTERFGIRFNPVLSHHVVEPDHGPGEVMIQAGTGIFGDGFKAYMKDTCTITVSKGAKALVTDKGDVMIASARVGRGTVLAVVDPWFYNEYADGRKMGEYEGFRAARDVAAWAVKQAGVER